MSGFLRRFRGVLGISVTWSVACATVFTGLFIGTAIFDPGSIDPGEGPLRIAAIGATLGFVSGAMFAVLLSIADRRKTIREVSLRRAALWGALGAAAFPLLTTANNSMLLILCPLGASLAAASVAVAKRASLSAPAEQLKLEK